MRFKQNGLLRIAGGAGSYISNSKFLCFFVCSFQENRMALLEVCAELGAVTTTVATAEEACKLAQAVLQRHLAACVQVEAVVSHYRWGALCAKKANTAWSARPCLRPCPHCWACCGRSTPYDLPELVVQPLRATAEYADWVRQEVQAAWRRVRPPGRSVAPCLRRRLRADKRCSNARRPGRCCVRRAGRKGLSAEARSSAPTPISCRVRSGPAPSAEGVHTRSWSNTASFSSIQPLPSSSCWASSANLTGGRAEQFQAIVNALVLVAVQRQIAGCLPAAAPSRSAVAIEVEGKAQVLQLGGGTVKVDDQRIHRLAASPRRRLLRFLRGKATLHVQLQGEAEFLPIGGAHDAFCRPNWCVLILPAPCAVRPPGKTGAARGLQGGCMRGWQEHGDLAAKGQFGRQVVICAMPVMRSIRSRSMARRGVRLASVVSVRVVVHARCAAGSQRRPGVRRPRCQRSPGGGRALVGRWPTQASPSVRFATARDGVVLCLQVQGPRTRFSWGNLHGMDGGLSACLPQQLERGLYPQPASTRCSKASSGSGRPNR